MSYRDDCKRTLGIDELDGVKSVLPVLAALAPARRGSPRILRPGNSISLHQSFYDAITHGRLDISAASAFLIPTPGSPSSEY